MDLNNFNDFTVWEASSRDTIDFKKVYVDVAGGIMVGLMLSEIVYWYLPDKTGERDKLRVRHGGVMWIAVRRQDWWERARMTVNQADYALSKLIKLGIVEKKVFRFNTFPTTHIRLLEDKFLEFIEDKLKNPLENPFSPNSEMDFTELEDPISDNSENDLGKNPKTLTETTNIDYLNITAAKGGGSVDEDGWPISKTLNEEPRKQSKLLTKTPPQRVKTSLAHNETTYVNPGEEFEEETINIPGNNVPKWKKPNDDLCELAFGAVGRKYFANKKERSRWIEIRKAAMSLDTKGATKYPIEWIKTIIQWATDTNKSYRAQTQKFVSKITFPALLSAIENEERRKDWVSYMLTHPEALRKLRGRDFTEEEADRIIELSPEEEYREVLQAYERACKRDFGW